MIEEPRSIFRGEALAVRAGRPAAGETLERAAPWVEPLFWILLVVCAAALGACLTATVPRCAGSPARLDSKQPVVCVGSEPMLFAFVPGLRQLLGRGDD